ncbi:MAG: magnesium transporter [Defluviitaleaceae bacterium]|nr:magnesium transporter [Defluviitaleaceae bacterium]
MNTDNKIVNFNNVVLSHIKSKDMTSLKTLLNSANEVDILDMIWELSAENQVVVFRLLSKDKALFVFERLDTSYQQSLIRSFTEDSAVEMIMALEPDERVRLFDEMPATFVKKMLSALSQEEREMTNLLMGYETQTAGRIMTPEYVRISRNMTVAEALDKVKENAKEKETIYTIYITDDSRKLEGVISLRDLWIADPSAKVENVMQKITAQVSTDTDQEEVAKLLQRLDWLAIPVVDKENRLVGIVTIDDAIDILEEEATEDILDAAGFADIAGKETDRSEVLTKGRIWKIWAVRLPFLLITLAAGMAAGLIIEGFEEILESVVIVAFFIPLIMDMGGNVGTQSSTVFARGVVLGHINIKNFLKPFLKEFGVGLSMGAMVGAIAGVIITFWLGLPMLGIAVGIALILTMTLAAVLGFLVPFILMKLKVDQAAGSAPIITSVKDISGLFIYFGLIALLMGSYLVPNYEVTGKFVTVDGIHFFVDLETEEAVVLRQEDASYDIIIPEEITIGDETFPVTGVEDDMLRNNPSSSVDE